ncbi:MAG: hypothetical protein GXO14_03560 [Thermococci archaeon]|nr:hypothetical protein [Thermococci archaeon]
MDMGREMGSRRALRWSNRQRIRQEAYDLGYRIGLYSHSEWMPWAVKARRAIMIRARMIGILQEAISEYERGKSEGASYRKEVINSVLEPPREHQITDTNAGLESIEKARLERMWETEARHYRTRRQSMYPVLLHRVSLYVSPSLIKRHRASRRPRLLNVPKFLKP